MAKRRDKSNVVLKDSVSSQIARVRSYESFGPAPPSPSLSINRSTYNVSQFNQDFIPIPTTTEEKFERFKPDLSGQAWLKLLKSLFPISLWLPEYDYRQNLMADIMVGITIAIFQVPQSMGYCLIAHVPPVYGLYSAFFPALFYTFLGTGHHCAFGAFALVSGVMTGDIVIQVMHELGRDVSEGMSISGMSSVTDSSGLATAITTASDEFPGLQTIDIAIMVSFIIGCYIVPFGGLQLGFISSFMSEELISGFTTSASVLVFVSQLRYLLGVNLSHFSGPFNLIWTLKEIFLRLAEVNMTTLKISGICLSILLIFKLGVNRLTAKFIKTPFPIELFVVIGGTLVSHYLDLKGDHYKVVIVGPIGNKFPAPILPKMELWPIMWKKCIATAIVGYTITLSVCKIYGKKHGYKINPTQEMIAMGVTNILSSFFQCIPAAASLPRSALQETAGGKTQVVSIVNCCCIVVVILALGKYLEELPTCVLGSCIAVALVSLITKIGDFVRFWKVSKLDGMIWLITFFGVVIISVDIGIYLGIVCSLLLLIFKSSRPKIYLLGTIEGIDIYVPINKFNKVIEPEGFKIFQMCGPLNFSNVDYFSSQLEDKCEINVTQLKKFMKTKEYERNVAKVEKSQYDALPPLKLTRLALNEKLPKYLIIDCSMFSFIDFSGIVTLKKTIITFEEVGIMTVLSGVHVHLESMFAKEGFFDVIPIEHIFKSVHDAVVSLQEYDNLFMKNNLNEQDNDDDGVYTKHFSTQMDSNKNSFKSDSIDSLNNSFRVEQIPYLTDRTIKIPRIYSLNGHHDTRAPNQPSSPLVRSSPIQRLNEIELDPSKLRVEDSKLNLSSSAPDLVSTSAPNLEFTSPSTSESDNSYDGPEMERLVSEDRDDQGKSGAKNQAISNDLYYLAPDYDHVPTPPPVPKSPIPVPPPLPPTPYTKNTNKPIVANNMIRNNRIKTNKQNENDDKKSNKRISASLKERSKMVEKVLENHRISDA